MPTPQAQPFSIDVPDEVLVDLRDRLARTRLLPDSPDKPASGMSAGYLGELVASWRELDWRARERWLNEHPQYLVDLGDVTMHFAHLRAAREDAPALLVMHGWPHTFALQLAFADLLTDFHVVVPSLPGFAFSSPYRSGFMENQRLADTMNRLMTEVLGYDRFLTYGEDVTADVNDLLAATHPESVQGVMVTHAHFPTMQERADLEDPLAIAFFDRLDADRYAMSGYAHEQGTRPDTLAVGLNDSPAGLLAWIAEKLVEWSDTPEGDPRAVEHRISRERILTEATIYWVTQTIASSFRPYFEPRQDAPIPPVTVPASVHIQRHERDNPESVARAFYRDLRTFERLEEGGHFAVAEVPELMAERTRAFARELGVLPG
jgi:pimeloyl-ACP methyl ester carboxylesterase